jgi:hypothetical protein
MNILVQYNPCRTSNSRQYKVLEGLLVDVQHGTRVKEDIRPLPVAELR